MTKLSVVRLRQDSLQNHHQVSHETFLTRLTRAFSISLFCVLVLSAIDLFAQSQRLGIPAGRYPVPATGKVAIPSYCLDMRLVAPSPGADLTWFHEYGKNQALVMIGGVQKTLSEAIASGNISFQGSGAPNVAMLLNHSGQDAELVLLDAIITAESKRDVAGVDKSLLKSIELNEAFQEIFPMTKPDEIEARLSKMPRLAKERLLAKARQRQQERIWEPQRKAFEEEHWANDSNRMEICKALSDTESVMMTWRFNGSEKTLDIVIGTKSLTLTKDEFEELISGDVPDALKRALQLIPASVPIVICQDSVSAWSSRREVQRLLRYDKERDLIGSRPMELTDAELTNMMTLRMSRFMQQCVYDAIIGIVGNKNEVYLDDDPMVAKNNLLFMNNQSIRSLDDVYVINIDKQFKEGRYINTEGKSIYHSIDVQGQDDRGLRNAFAAITTKSPAIFIAMTRKNSDFRRILYAASESGFLKAKILILISCGEGGEEGVNSYMINLPGLGPHAVLYFSSRIEQAEAQILLDYLLQKIARQSNPLEPRTILQLFKEAIDELINEESEDLKIDDSSKEPLRHIRECIRLQISFFLLIEAVSQYDDSLNCITTPHQQRNMTTPTRSEDGFIFPLKTSDFFGDYVTYGHLGTDSDEKDASSLFKGVTLRLGPKCDLVRLTPEMLRENDVFFDDNFFRSNQFRILIFKVGIIERDDWRFVSKLAIQTRIVKPVPEDARVCWAFPSTEFAEPSSKLQMSGYINADFELSPSKTPIFGNIVKQFFSKGNDFTLGVGGTLAGKCVIAGKTKTAKIQNIYKNDFICEWLFRRDDEPLVGDIIVAQMIAVPPRTKEIVMDLSACVAVRKAGILPHFTKYIDCTVRYSPTKLPMGDNLEGTPVLNPS